MRRTGTAAVLGTLVVALLSGCSGASCGRLDGLRAERDTARQAYAARTPPAGASIAADPEGDAEHDALHAVERQVYDLEQSCG